MFLTWASPAVWSQTNVVTNLCTTAFYNEENEDFEVLKEEAEITLFEFDKKMTSFHHTKADIDSEYTVKTKKYDKAKKTYELEIISDVGNEYLMLWNEDAGTLQFLFKKDGAIVVVQHKIMRQWKGTGTKK